MDVRAALASAQITRIAIVDDDLSTRITESDLRERHPEIAALLNDPMDPDLEAYRAVLAGKGRAAASVEDLVGLLAEEDVRVEAPRRIREAAEAVLIQRAENAEPVERVIKMLKSLGISEGNIHRYDTPAIDDGQFYDLIIVDYFLVNTSTESTLPFIKEMLDKHLEQEHALQVILMSSHDQRLIADFRDIRPKLGASSSRMRIMEKPRTDMHLIGWNAAILQLANDRRDVRRLERFITEAGTVLKEAGRSVSEGLWEVDLQAIDLLHELASKDHDDFSRYVEDALSRRLLSAVEADGGMRPSLQQLDEALGGNGTKSLLSPSGEVGDSRAAIHGLMHSMEWRAGAVMLPAFPAGGPVEEQAAWIKSNIRFGMVLQDQGGGDWLNITQACDLAQAEPEAFGSSSVLLIRGQQKLPPVEMKSDYYVSMSAIRATHENHVLTWNLRDLRAESIADFATTYADGWQVIGELRPDRAQDISVKFGSRTARVGLPVKLSAWRLGGQAILISRLKTAAADTLLEGIALSGHAIQRARAKKHELQLDWTSVDALLTEHETLGESFVSLLTGISLTPGGVQQSGGQVIFGYASGNACFTVGDATREFAKTIDNPQNAERLLVMLWGAS